MATKTFGRNELEAQLAKLEAENSALKKLASSGKKEVTFKVGEKGGVSVYGLARFPVTLYKEQWETLFAAKQQIEAFIEANKAQLKTRSSGGN